MRALSLSLVVGLFAFSLLPFGTTQDVKKIPGGPGDEVERFAPPPVLDPVPFDVINAPAVTLTGRAVGAKAVEVAAAEDVFLATLNGLSFTADVQLAQDQVNTIYFTSLFADGARSTPVAVRIAEDSTPPDVFIDFPEDGAEITQLTVNVGGRVSDLMSDFEELVVTVNGVPAFTEAGVMNHGTFFAQGVPLVPGQSNVLTAQAVDAVGNFATDSVTVEQVEIPPGSPRMTIVGGESQSALVNTELPDPLVVHVEKGDGSDFVGKLVTFRVTRSDGLLGETSGGPSSRLLQLHTNANGEVTVFWTLGSDAGCGNNRVEVKSTSIAGSVLFCASGNPGRPTQIELSTGDNQTAEVGSPAIEPLSVWVHDGRNGVSGELVTFSVTQGGALVNGGDVTAVLTDATGHAEVDLTLGPDPGVNSIEATFGSNPALPATFTAFGVKRDESIPTSFVGLVLDNSRQPIQGAEVTLTVGETTLATVPTGIDGTFRVDDAPGGPGHLKIDGLPAFHVGGVDGVDVPTGSFPFLLFEVLVIPDAENSLPMPIELPPLNPNNAMHYNGVAEAVLTVEGMEGLSIRVPPASEGTVVTKADGTTVSPANPITLALNQVHFDKIPMPMPDGAGPSFAWTLQPGGTRFDPPLVVKIPNLEGQLPGTISYLTSFNHDTGRFEIVATARVSEDGAQLESDQGGGIAKAGWGGSAPPPPPRGNVGGGPGPPAPPLPCPDCEPPPLDCPPAALEQQCGGGGGCTDQRTDPVYLFSGEVYLSVEDLRIRGRGPDFVWARKYRSKIGPNTAQGNGWDFSYNMFLRTQGLDLIVCDGNSRQDVYRLQSDGTWATHGIFREISKNADETYTLLFANLGKWNFHAIDGAPESGKIASIVDRNDNQLGFTYDGLGRLATVTDTLDRDIDIAYDDDGFIETVTDFAGREVRYEYYVDGDRDGSAGDLKSVRSPQVMNVPMDHGNAFPSGKTTTYTYTTGFADDRLNHNLVSITDPKGQTFVENTYASTLDPGDLEFDRIERQIWGDPDDIIDLVYVQRTPGEENGGAILSVILNDRVGNVAEYFYDDYNREVLVKRYTGRWPADQPTTEVELAAPPPIAKLRPGDPDVFETRTEWNYDYLPTRQTEPDGDVRVFLNECDLDPKAKPRMRANLRLKAHVPGGHPAPGEQELLVEVFEYDDDLGGGCCGSNFVTRHIDSRGNVTVHDYDPKGNRLHTQHRVASILEDFEYNAFGQLTARVHPDNGSGHRRRDELTYYDSGPERGYLKEEIVDKDMSGMDLQLTTTFEYDLVGNVIRVIDPRGNDTLYDVNELDQIVRETSREVTPGVRYERDTYYDANDNVARIDVQNVDETGQVVVANPYLSTITEFDVLNRRTRTCQESGSHDVPRLPVPQLDCTGLPESEFISTEIEYDPSRNQTLIRFGEAAEGRQPTNVVRSVYDERDLLYQEIRAEGDPSVSTTQYDYDGNANLIRTAQGIEDTPRVTTHVYDSFHRMVGTIDPMGNVSSYSYDDNGNMVSVRAEGELVDLPGSGGNVRLSQVTSTYDEMDRRIVRKVDFFDTETQTDLPGGQELGKSVTTSEYSDNSQVVRVVNDNLHETLTEYDRANRAFRMTDAKGNTVTTNYDDNGNVVQVDEVDKSDLGLPDEEFTTTFAYDGLDRQTTVVDNVGNTTTRAHDSRSNVTLSVDPLANAVRFDYDGVDRLVATTRFLTDDGTGNGNPAGEIVTRQGWDDTSRLVSQTDDETNATRYAYDALNRRIVTQMADGTLHQVGSGANWRLADSEPDLTSFTTGYDVHDNQVTRVDANGSVVVCEYDLLNRPADDPVSGDPARTITPGAGVSGDTTFERYQYDGLSRLVRAEDDDSTVLRSYDSLSNVTREDIDSEVTTCVYDGVGNQTLCTYPGPTSSPREIACTFDELERKKTIVDVTIPFNPKTIATYEYVGPARVTRREYGNNTRCDYSYDGITGVPNPPGDFGVKRIIGTTHVSDPDGSPFFLDVRTYTWDPLYNKTRRKDTRPGGPQLTHDYQYDSTYRLVDTSVTDAGGGSVRDTSYELDGVGNRTVVSGSPDPGPYARDATLPDPADFQVNQYTTTSFDAREYDENGNLAVIDEQQASERVLAYDYRNQMVQVVDAGSGQRHTYAYDTLGRRIRRIVDADGAADETHYVYDGWQVVVEQDSSRTTDATYVYGLYIDEVLQMRREGVDSYYHSDDLHNVVAVTDATGVVVERTEYQDYGSPEFFDANGVAMDSSGLANPLLFTGRRYDPESALYYYRTRHLDPAGGRFLTRDVIGIWGTDRNLGSGCAYLGNNPWSLTDPMGLGDEDEQERKQRIFKKKLEMLKLLGDVILACDCDDEIATKVRAARERFIDRHFKNRAELQDAIEDFKGRVESIERAGDYLNKGLNVKDFFNGLTFAEMQLLSNNAELLKVLSDVSLLLKTGAALTSEDMVEFTLRIGEIAAGLSGGAGGAISPFLGLYVNGYTTALRMIDNLAISNKVFEDLKLLRRWCRQSAKGNNEAKRNAQAISDYVTRWFR